MTDKTRIWRVRLDLRELTYYTDRPMTPDQFEAHIPKMFLTGIIAFKSNFSNDWKEVKRD